MHGGGIGEVLSKPPYCFTLENFNNGRCNDAMEAPSFVRAERRADHGFFTGLSLSKQVLTRCGSPLSRAHGPSCSIFTYVKLTHFNHKQTKQATQRRAAQRQAGAGAAATGRPAGAGNNILQFYTDDSPGLQVGPTTVLVASLSFVGFVVLLHILGKFRS